MQKITSKKIQELTKKYMRMSREQLLAAAQDPALPMHDYVVVQAIALAAKTGDFSKVSRSVEKAFEGLLDDVSPPAKAEVEISPNAYVIDRDEPIDIPKMREVLAKSIYASTQMTANQAVKEYQRVEHMRGVIQMIEEHLIAPEVFKRMTTTDKIRMYGAALTNQSMNLRYLTSLNTTLIDGVEALAQVQKLKDGEVETEKLSSIQTGKVDEVKSMVIQRLKELAAAKNKEDAS